MVQKDALKLGRRTGVQRQWVLVERIGEIRTWNAKIMWKILQTSFQTIKKEGVQYWDPRWSLPSCLVLPDERVCKSSWQISWTCDRKCSMAYGSNDGRYSRKKWTFKNFYQLSRSHIKWWDSKKVSSKYKENADSVLKNISHWPF